MGLKSGRGEKKSGKRLEVGKGRKEDGNMSLDDYRRWERMET